jgi:hypothetical protein
MKIGQSEPIPANCGQSGYALWNGQSLHLVLLFNYFIMPRQIGAIKIVGTIDGVTYYIMDGVHYVRRKSSLDRKRILRDPKFQRFRECSKVFGKASKLASQFYRLFPKEQRMHGVYGKLTGEFNLLFREGKTSEQAVKIMMRKYLKVVVVKVGKKKELPTIIADNSPLSNSFINKEGELLNKEHSFLIPSSFEIPCSPACGGTGFVRYSSPNSKFPIPNYSH